LDDAGNDGGHDDTSSEPNKPLVVKKVAPLIASKKTANNINKWNQVQEELAQDTTPNAVQNVIPKATVSTSAAPVTSRAAVEMPSETEVEFEFSDVTSLMCLLCARQFKTSEQLKRHNKESELHKKNFKDVNLREIARQKAASRRVGTSEAPKYRDRASERRTLFNQPEAPIPEKDPSVSKKRQVEAPRPPTPPVDLANDDANVGNKLLKMMGWKAGSGLGSEGDGRVNPIETAVYSPGMGLGASKGRDIGKYTDGFSSYFHMAQDSARERYGN
jgi:hypothetical protein